MSIHRELAALVRQVGPDVLLDASEFRAAFDDFVLEGSATEGDVNLLTDSIRLGALGRVLGQIRQGAEPRLAVESQGLRLAQQRGTQEAFGAQWALAVLAFASGVLDEQVLLTDFRAPWESATPAAFPVPPSTVAPGQTARGAVNEGAVAPAQPLTALPPRTALAPTVRPSTTVASAPSRRPTSRTALVLRWVAAVALISGLVAAAVLVLSSDDKPRSPDADPPISAQTVPTGTVIATDQISLPAPAGPVVLAGRTGGLKVTGLGSVEQIEAEEEVRVAASGDRLIGFAIAKGPCQNARCSAWKQLPLRVLVDGTPQRLPPGGPTFVVAAPTDVPVELQFKADGFDQRVSLVDGAATGENIQVLTRSDLTGRVIGGPKTIQPTTTTPGINLGADDRRTFDPRRAELSFFMNEDTPGQSDQAYLRINANYTKVGRTGEFLTSPQLVRLEARDGTPYPKRNLGTASKPDTVFVVPAAFSRGTLVIGGTTTAHDSDFDVDFDLTLPRTTFDVRY